MPINIERIERLLHAAQEFKNCREFAKSMIPVFTKQVTAATHHGFEIAKTEPTEINTALLEDIKTIVTAFEGLVNTIQHEHMPSYEAEMVLMEEAIVQKHNKVHNTKMKLVMQQRRNKAKCGE